MRKERGLYVSSPPPDQMEGPEVSSPCPVGVWGAGSHVGKQRGELRVKQLLWEGHQLCCPLWEERQKAWVLSAGLQAIRENRDLRGVTPPPAQSSTVPTSHPKQSFVLPGAVLPGVPESYL